MHIKFDLNHRVFSAQLAKELIAEGLTVIDAVEKLLSEWLEISVSDSLKTALIKAPRGVVHPGYYKNRFQNLAILSQEGYTTWYPEVRFSTAKDDSLELADIRVIGIELGTLVYGVSPAREYQYKRKELKTQTNHTIRLNTVTIPPEVFGNVVGMVKDKIPQPYIANLTYGCDPVDFRVEGFQIVSFDHIVTGERKFCRCHAPAHATMLEDAKAMAASYSPNSWPHRTIATLQSALYADGLCHLCISEKDGQGASVEQYGTQIYTNYAPYVDVLLRSTDMDRRTSNAEVKRRLGISRWKREGELYELINRLFPHTVIRREASPEWLGRQRLDIYLPELLLAIEHQGKQHYSPIAVFGGEAAFEKTKERDELKRALCRENGVTVVDIKYDYPLTISNLRSRLRRWLVVPASK